jgi:elongation factor P
VPSCARRSRTPAPGAQIERTFRAGEKVEQAVIDKREMQYLYPEGNELVFMDNSSYDQLTISPARSGRPPASWSAGSNAVMLMWKDEIVGVELPAAVELTITATEPGVQGDRVSGARKPATLETGLVVQVPLFVNQGEKIKVDTRSGDYMTRV